MRIDRRDLLRTAGGAATLALLPRWGAPALASDGEAGRVLVVLQLSGGNDGLSTVVPYGDAEYYRLRRATAIRREEILPLERGLGLHPGLAPWHRMWTEGTLGIVLGAGYPKPNRSHFRSMDIWHAADAEGRGKGTGWLGRALDVGLPGEGGVEGAVNIGQEIPYALEADRNKAVSFEHAEAYRWLGRDAERRAFEALNQAERGDHVVPWLHRKGADALASSARIREAFATYRPRAEYPRRGGLGKDLSLVTALVAGGIPTRVYYLQTGGFDTHTSQRGRHDQLMRGLGEATAAFFADLEAHGVADRVVLAAFSEFGRRPRENGSAGTDHGTAGPCFVLGPAVRGGIVGRQPKLDRLDRNGDLVHTTDFRSLYATLLDDWMGVDARAVLGRTWPGLDLIR